MHVFKLQVDFQRSMPFQRLEEIFSPAEPGERKIKATFVWMACWTDLTYKAMEGQLPGLIRESDLPFLLRSLEPCGSAGHWPAVSGGLAGNSIETEPSGESPDGAGGPPALPLFLRLVDPVKLFVKVEEGWLCPIFAQANGDLNPNRPSQHSTGGSMRAFKKNMERSTKRFLQGSLAIPSEIFQDAEGQPLDGEVVKRVRMLVIAFDSALFHGERASHMWTNSLVLDALAVMKKYTDEEINEMARTIVKFRGHAALNGMSTKELLPQLEGVMGKMGGER